MTNFNIEQPKFKIGQIVDFKDYNVNKRGKIEAIKQNLKVISHQDGLYAPEANGWFYDLRVMAENTFDYRGALYASIAEKRLTLYDQAAKDRENLANSGINFDSSKLELLSYSYRSKPNVDYFYGVQGFSTQTIAPEEITVTFRKKK